jgi:hypothetical protein
MNKSWSRFNARVMMTNLPTSTAGLAPGDLWRNGNSVMIVPD